MSPHTQLHPVAGDDVLHVLEQRADLFLAAVFPVAFAQAVAAEGDMYVRADAVLRQAGARSASGSRRWRESGAWNWPFLPARRPGRRRRRCRTFPRIRRGRGAPPGCWPTGRRSNNRSRNRPRAGVWWRSLQVPGGLVTRAIVQSTALTGFDSNQERWGVSPQVIRHRRRACGCRESRCAAAVPRWSRHRLADAGCARRFPAGCPASRRSAAWARRA